MLQQADVNELLKITLHKRHSKKQEGVRLFQKTVIRSLYDYFCSR